jgi:hypothetical protein
MYASNRSSQSLTQLEFWRACLPQIQIKAQPGGNRNSHSGCRN